MEKLNRQKVMAVAAGIAMFLAFGIFVGVYQAREEATSTLDAVVKQLVEGKKKNAYAAEIEDLEHLTAHRFIREKDRIRAYSALATIYIWQVDYVNAVKYSVRAICSAEKIDKQMSAAWSYLQLTDIFLRLGVYDTAESLVWQALDYPLDEEEEQRRVKELAYINMAEICAATSRNDEARRYLDMADEIENEKDFNHPHMVQAKRVIRAESFWNEGGFAAAKETLASVDETNNETDIHLIYVQMPLLELKSKLAFAEGDIQKGQEYSKRILEFYTSHNDKMKTIEYLTALIHLLREKEPALADAYNARLIALYPQAMHEANALTAQFLLSAHQESLSNYHEQADRSFLLAVVVGCLLALSCLLYMFRRIWHQIRIDPLTGGYNRRYLNQMYGKYKKRNIYFGVIMLDIDYFKQVNDTWGHEIGDEVLKSLSVMCLAALPTGAKLFRFGGEEFCILYQTKDRTKVIALAHEIRERVEAMQWKEESLKVTVSLGVAYTGEAKELLLLADQNLYQSKMKGRNSVTYCGEA